MSGSMMYLDDDARGEVQRGADGSRLSILQVIENDEGNAQILNPEMLKAQREEFLLQHRAVNAESVPELHRRLIQRREVMATLGHWTNRVLRKRGTDFGDDEHIDAEQLEEEIKASKGGGVGVGATLRAYWNATVQDEVELRFNTMRVAWEKEAAADMAELKDFREKGRKLKTELEDTKQQLAGLSIKYEVAQKQVISAQRAAPIKQAASSAEPEAPKPSAGELAVVEATLIQLKTELSNVKGQLDMANARAELYEGQVSKSGSDLESAQAENAALLAKLQEAEVKLSQGQNTEVGSTQAVHPGQELEDQGPPAMEGASQAAPRLAPTPSKGGRDGRGESAKLKKDLDKLQVEHAKLQMSLKAKMGEVEKLAKELKEVRMKSPPRAATGAATPAAAKSPARGAPLAQSLSKSKSRKGKQKDGGDEEPARDRASSHGTRNESKKSKDDGRDTPAEDGINLQKDRGNQMRGGGRSPSPNSESGSLRDGKADEGKAHKEDRSSRHSNKGRSSRSHSPDGAASRIRSLENTVARLTKQLEGMEAKGADQREGSSPDGSVVPMPAGKGARAEAELQAAKAQIADLQAEVKRLQKELRALKESGSAQQQKLTVEVELNKRLRLLQKLREGTNHVESMLAAAQDVSKDGDVQLLHQRVDAGAKELESLVQALEAEFGMPGKVLPRLQPSHRGSSTGKRMTLDSEDLSILLTSSTNRVQEMANKRSSLTEASAQRRSAAGHLLPPAARPAGHRGSTRPASSRTVGFQGNEQPLTEDGQDSAVQVDLGASTHPSTAGLSSRPASSCRTEEDPWGDAQASLQEEEHMGSQPSTRYLPPSSQLPGTRSQGVGVSTVMGRQGPQVFGMRPPRSQIGSIEDATRWGGMFERLHASYLDPNGVWRVYTQRDGPSDPVESLQPLLEGAQYAAQRAEASAKAAASAMTPYGHFADLTGTGAQGGNVSSRASMGNSRRGRALEPTRRPQSAMPASNGLHARQQQQQTAELGQQQLLPHHDQHFHHQYQQQQQQQQQIAEFYQQQPLPHHDQHYHHQYHQQQQQQQLPLHDQRGPTSCSASRSPSPPTQQDVHSGWSHQVGSQGAGPPLLKHNVYQQQLDQPAGTFNVRMLTATPQKGIMLRSRPRSAHPGSAGQWDLGPGEGEPQRPPSPQPFTIGQRIGNSIGLSVPSTTVSLQPAPGLPGMPAGGVLHTPGSSCPVYNGIELMSRMELVGAVRNMEAYVKDIAARFNCMVEDRSLTDQIHSELALEIAEAREHWVVENEYNSHLQDEVGRLHAILARLAAEAEQGEPVMEASAGQLPSRPSSPRAAEVHAAMQRVHQVEHLQEQHLNEAEVAAGRLNLPSPTSIRAKLAKQAQGKQHGAEQAGVELKGRQKEEVTMLY